MSICRETIKDALHEMNEYGAISYEPSQAVWPRLEKALQKDDLKTMYKVVKEAAPKVDVSDDQIVDIVKRIAFHDKIQDKQRHHERKKYLIMRAIGEAFTAVEGFQYFHGDTPKKGADFSPEAYAAAVIVILTMQRCGSGGKYGLGVMMTSDPSMVANRYYWSHIPTPLFEAWDVWDSAMEEAIADCAELLRAYSIRAVNEYGDGECKFEKEQDEALTLLDACLRRRVISQNEIVDVYLAAVGYNSHVPWSDFRIPDWVVEAYSVADGKEEFNQ